MRQFDAVRLKGGQLVVILQADRLSAFSTRVVAQVIPLAEARPASHLHPQVILGDERYLIAVEQLTAIRVSDIAGFVTSFIDQEYRIRRAFDFLTTGA